MGGLAEEPSGVAEFTFVRLVWDSLERVGGPQAAPKGACKWSLSEFNLIIIIIIFTSSKNTDAPPARETSPGRARKFNLVGAS